MQLIVQNGSNSGRKIELTTRPIIVGREANADLALNDIQLSGRHARFDFQNGRVYVTDLVSANGIYLNGQRLPPSQPYPVKPGDNLQIGSTLFAVQPDAAAAYNNYQPAQTYAPSPTSKTYQPEPAQSFPPPAPYQAGYGQNYPPGNFLSGQPSLPALKLVRFPNLRLWLVGGGIGLVAIVVLVIVVAIAGGGSKTPENAKNGVTVPATASAGKGLLPTPTNGDKQAAKAAAPTANSGKLGEVGDIEKDLPVYPGARSAVEKDNPKVTVIYYSTGDDYSKVKDWALKTYNAKGWQGEFFPYPTQQYTNGSLNKNGYYAVVIIAGPLDRDADSVAGAQKLGAGPNDTIIVIIVTKPN